MHQINFSDELYRNAERRAAEAGFASVEAYVANLVEHDANGDIFDPDTFFTHQRLAEIEAASADVRSGNFLTMEQSQADLARLKEEWRKEHPDAQ